MSKGLFTYYVSQNHGFLDPPSPLRQQWSSFGLPPLPPSSAIVSIWLTPPPPLVSFRQLLPDASFVLQFFTHTCLHDKMENLHLLWFNLHIIWLYNTMNGKIVINCPLYPHFCTHKIPLMKKFQTPPPLSAIISIWLTPMPG